MIFSCCFLAVAAVSFWSCLSIDPRSYGLAEIDAVIIDLCEAKKVAQFLKCRAKEPETRRTSSAQAALVPEPEHHQNIKFRKDPEGVTIYAELRPTRSASIIVRDGDSAKAGKPIERPIHVAIKYYLGARTGEEKKEWYQMERRGTEEFAAIKAGPPVVDVLSHSNRPLLGDDVLIVMHIPGPTGNEVLRFILSSLEERCGRPGATIGKRIHRRGLLARNAQSAALGAVLHVHANNLRHCMASLNNTFFKLPTAEDLRRYTSRLPEMSSRARDFLYKTKVFPWPLPDGSTVPLLLEPDMVMFVNSLLVEKVKDQQAKHCILPSGRQQSDIWMITITNDAELAKIPERSILWLAEIEAAFFELRMDGKRGENHLTVAQESRFGDMGSRYLAEDISLAEVRAIEALRLS